MVWPWQSWAVNAYYDNTVNAVFIPAGILQPPFFNESAKMEQNFGGIGAIVGHELTHGFDNLGSRFDSKQDVRDWWTPHVNTEFHKRMQCIAGEVARGRALWRAAGVHADVCYARADLYSGFQIADSQVVGSRTLDENMADFGGTKVAHQALLAWQEQDTGTKTSVAGERLFFTSFAQLWCEKGRRASLQSRVLQDMHSPGPFRANGVVSQNADFARAFGCATNSPMNPDFKCSVWKDRASGQSLSERNGSAVEREGRQTGPSSGRKETSPDDGRLGGGSRGEPGSLGDSALANGEGAGMGWGLAGSAAADWAGGLTGGMPLEAHLLAPRLP